MSIAQGAKGRFDGFIVGVWHDLNTGGGAPTPTATVSDRTHLVIEGGFRFNKVFPIIVSGHGSIRIAVEADTEIHLGRGAVAVEIVAEGSFPSFAMSGTGTFEDVSQLGILRRVFTLLTPEGDTVTATQRFFDANLRWYQGVEFVFHPAHGSSASVIFEDMSDSKLQASPARDEDPRPSPFDET